MQGAGIGESPDNCIRIMVELKFKAYTPNLALLNYLELKL